MTPQQKFPWVRCRRLGTSILREDWNDIFLPKFILYKEQLQINQPDFLQHEKKFGMTTEVTQKTEIWDSKIPFYNFTKHLNFSWHIFQRYEAIMK